MHLAPQLRTKGKLYQIVILLVTIYFHPAPEEFHQPKQLMEKQDVENI